MPLPSQIELYEGIRPYFDRALESPRGTKITCADHGQAMHLRQRLYKLRQLEQVRSQTIFEPGDTRYGTSPYDNLVCKVEDNALMILRREPLVIEDI